jgi:hypothetical protein
LEVGDTAGLETCATQHQDARAKHIPESFRGCATVKSIALLPNCKISKNSQLLVSPIAFATGGQAKHSSPIPRLDGNTLQDIQQNSKFFSADVIILPN